MKKTTVLAAVAMALTASPAFAHLNPAEHGSFAAGFTHPLSGADHILAMVAVGLWAAMLGGRALFVVPAAFVGVMLLGFVAALLGMPLPFVEPVILASVVVLGLMVALAFLSLRLLVHLLPASSPSFTVMHTAGKSEARHSSPMRLDLRLRPHCYTPLAWVSALPQDGLWRARMAKLLCVWPVALPHLAA